MKNKKAKVKRQKHPKPDDRVKTVAKEGAQLLKDAAKQARLPGMEDAAIQDIEDAAQSYGALIRERMAALRKEITAGELLLGIMKKHGKLAYHRDGLHVFTTETKEKVRVKFDTDEESES